MHPEISKDDYALRYWTLSGKDPAKLKQHCNLCGRKKELNFRRMQYRECPCVLAEKKLQRVIAEKAAEQDPAKQTRLSRKIGGLRSFIKKYRGSDRNDSPPLSHEVRGKRFNSRPSH